MKIHIVLEPINLRVELSKHGVKEREALRNIALSGKKRERFIVIAFTRETANVKRAG